MQLYPSLTHSLSSKSYHRKFDTLNPSWTRDFSKRNNDGMKWSVHSKVHTIEKFHKTGKVSLDICVTIEQLIEVLSIRW